MILSDLVVVTMDDSKQLKVAKATKSGNSMGSVNSVSAPEMRVLCNIQIYPTNKQISEYLQLNKGYVSRLTKSLLDKGLVNVTDFGHYKKFSMSETGIYAVASFLAVSRAKKTTELPVRGHDMWYSAFILSKPKDIEKKLKEDNWLAAYPNNWEQRRKKVLSCMVLWNPNRLLFLVDGAYTSTIDEYRVIAARYAQATKEYLEERYPGLKIGEPEEIIAKVKKQQLARQFDPLALEFYKTSQKENEKITYFGNNIDVDFSKKVPEVDFKSKVLASDQCHTLAEFFDKWLDDPISPHDLQEKIGKHDEHIERIYKVLIKLIGNGSSSQVERTIIEKGGHGEKDRPSYLG